jgi:hypothetical protein
MPKERVCPQCGVPKPIGKFYLKGGLRRSKICSDCENINKRASDDPVHVKDQGLDRPYPTAARKVKKVAADIFAELGV